MTVKQIRQVCDILERIRWAGPFEGDDVHQGQYFVKSKLFADRSKLARFMVARKIMWDFIRRVTDDCYDFQLGGIAYTGDDLQMPAEVDFKMTLDDFPAELIGGDHPNRMSPEDLNILTSVGILVE